jgi:SPP1 gp7 family putative phage head morphogenesis protein
MPTQNENGKGKRTLSKRDLDRMRSSLALDVARTTKAATGSWRMDIEGLIDVLGQPFDVTKIPLSKLHQMRRDPMIAFALLFCKVPLVRASWYMKSEHAQAAAFADNALRRIYARLIFQYTNSLDFGYSAIVKRFEFDRPDWTYIDHQKKNTPERKVWDSVLPALVWKPFQALPPDTVEPHWNEAGEFNGIITREIDHGRRQFPGQEKPKRKPDIPLEKALWATNEKDSVFGSLWGFPRIAYAYRYWWSYWYRWALSDRHFEKDADPALKIYYPLIEGVDADGEEVDYAELALELGERLRSGSNVALPSSLIRSDMEDKMSSQREWEMEFLTGGGNFAAFQETFSYLDIAKIRSIMVPEQAFFEGRGGTSSRNVAEQLGDVFFESQAVLMAEIDDHLNRFVIPQLVEANFGPGIHVEKVTRGFAQQDVELAKQIITLVGQADPTQLEVDLREILTQNGIPLLTPEQIKKKQEEMAAQAAIAAPPEMPGIPGKQAGVNQWGFYYTPNEVIELSEGKKKDDKLPPTRHYEDDEILNLMSSLQQDWRRYWAEQYDDFADFISKSDVFLAEGDDAGAVKKATMTAKEILDKWLQTPAQIAAISRRVAGFIRSVMDRAGKRELGRLRVEDVEWDQDRPEVVQWSQRRAATLVKNVSENTRKELRRFLTAEIDKTQSPVEIAERIRQHFGEWPTWKADRLARTETMMAYNQATLLAYKAAGVKRVKAHDAAVRQQSDPHCIARDGRVFTLNQAFKEQQDEHPNGTLFWSPVVDMNPLKMSFEYVTDFMFDGKHAVGYYDDVDQKMYLDERISDSDAELLFLAAGEAILPMLEEPQWDENKVLRDLRGRFAKKGEGRLAARKAMEELEHSGFIPKLKRRIVNAVVGEGLSLQERKHRQQFIDTLFELVREDPGYALPFLGVVTETLKESNESETALMSDVTYDRIEPRKSEPAEPVQVHVSGVTLSEVEAAIAPVRAKVEDFPEAIVAALKGLPPAQVIVNPAPPQEAPPTINVVNVPTPQVTTEITVPTVPPKRTNVIRDKRGMIVGTEEVEQ